jgi:glutaconyl-CoA decarboxylase
MSKKYRITIEGKAYEVEVEDIGQGAPVQLSSPVQVVAPAAAPAPAATAAPAPSAAPAAAAAPLKTDAVSGEALPAPMPGTILSVVVKAGQSVRKGEVLVILEAMKMENEIVAHHDGVIAGVYVQKGSVVNAGDPLVSFS